MKIRTGLTGLIISLFIVSCEYETIKFEAPLPENVSFENDILPLFDQSCNSAGCHNTGGWDPDLSRENAYSDISTDSEMVNTNTPEDSELYIRMIDNDSPMPLSGVLPPGETNLVLVWIREGALEN